MATQFNGPYPTDEFTQLISKPATNIETFTFKPKGERCLLEDLQAGILKHHKRKYGYYIFMEFSKADTKYLKILNWISSITSTSALTELRKEDKKSTLVNFFLSAKGYKDLKIKDLAPKSCPAFSKGLTDEVRGSFNEGTDNIFRKGKNGKMKFHAVLLIADDNYNKLEYIIKKDESLNKPKLEKTDESNDLKKKLKDLDAITIGNPQRQFAFLNRKGKKWKGKERNGLAIKTA